MGQSSTCKLEKPVFLVLLGLCIQEFGQLFRWRRFHLGKRNQLCKGRTEASSPNAVKYFEETQFTPLETAATQALRVIEDFDLKASEFKDLVASEKISTRLSTSKRRSSHRWRRRLRKRSGPSKTLTSRHPSSKICGVGENSTRSSTSKRRSSHRWRRRLCKR
jgi:hypothetical protein